MVLIDMFMNMGFVVMKNTFIDPGFGESDKFYEIDGEIYYCSTPYLVKCVTPVTTGGAE